MNVNAIVVDLSGRFGVNPKETKRFIKFAVVGSIGFLVDFGFFNLLSGPFRALLVEGQWAHNLLVGWGLATEQVLKLGPTFAGAVSFVAAIVSNFLWNRYWTYPDSRSKSRRRQFSMFALVSVIGIVIRLPIITLLHEPFAVPFEQLPALQPYAARLGDNAALALAVVVVMFWNFFANRYWTYNDVE